MLHHLIIYCFYLFLLFFPTKFLRAQQISIAQAEGHLTHRIAAGVVAEAYRRLNIKTEFVMLPNKRSLALANDGTFDAEVARVDHALNSQLNLLKVGNVPVVNIIGVAISKNVKCRCEQWRDLTGLTIGIIRGELYAKKGTEGMTVVMLKGYTELLTMLNKERIDIAIGILSTVELELQSNFKNSGLHIVGEPLVNLPLYHLVHKSQQALIPKLTIVFEDMALTGEIKRIQQKTLATILKERIPQ